jgi:hypothetical protein
MARLSAAVVLLVAYGLAACGGAERERTAASPVVRDSAGIRIIEERLDPDRTLELVEELRIGAVDGADYEQFFRINDMAVTPAGDLLVLDGGNHQVRVFAPDGTFRHSWGSEGQGPGEFTFLGSMAVGRDTVVVGDDRRVHVFDISGAHVSTTTTHQDRGITLTGFGISPTGWRVETAYAPVLVGDDEPNWKIADYDPVNGVVGEVVFERRVTDRTADVEGTRTSWTVRPPFSPRDQTVFGGSGQILVTRLARYEVHVLGPDGAVVQIVRPDWERRPVDDGLLSDWAASQEERFCAAESPMIDCDEYVSEALPVALALPHPAFVPPVALVFAGTEPSDGFLVLRGDVATDLFAAANPRVFDVFDGDGRCRGRLTAPVSFWPYVFQGDTVTGTIRDDFDVSYVVRYRLSSTGPGTP